MPAPSSPGVPSHPPTRRTLDGERLLTVFGQIVEPIGRALPSSSEVVLHDLSMLPNSIVAIAGSVTDRRIGDPATDLLLEQSMNGFPEHQLGYETTLPDGRKMRSSTMIIRDVAGNPIAALCINTDISAWLTIRDIANAAISGGAEPPVADVPRMPARDEQFVRDVDELASHLINQAMRGVGVPRAAMKKEHNLEVVRELKNRGVFTLRESVPKVAEALGVSRFTIYNYLNEIGDADAAADADGKES